MATNTYVALDKITLGTAAASITFSSISSAYTDLVIVVNAKASTVTNTYMQVGNGSVDTGSNYSRTQISGNGSAATSGRNTNQTLFYCDNNSAPDASNFNYVNTIHLMNYSNTTTNKTFLNCSNNVGYGVEAQVGLWRSTSAINTILLGVASGNWAVGTTFELYGIRAEGVSPTTKATGGAVYSDAVYYYHVFGASGAFTPTQSITADVLVVAGGGGGGGSGPGGGAGGFLTFTSQSLSATSYTCTVGAGGAAGYTNTQVGYRGTTGSDSQFGALTLVKGGGGGGANDNNGSQNGLAGGSGGGAGSAGANIGTGGAGTSGQGNAGGAGATDNNTYRYAGGGGGAGGVGEAGQTTRQGFGGVGLSTSISGGSATGAGHLVSGTYYFSGGGTGNSTGGSYGGGGVLSTAGASNTGGGGGASPFSTGSSLFGGAGGSGVVIVRYAK